MVIEISVFKFDRIRATQFFWGSYLGSYGTKEDNFDTVGKVMYLKLLSGHPNK